MTGTVEPFDAPDEVDLDDLRDRLARTRFAPPTPGEPWSEGPSPAFLRRDARRRHRPRHPRLRRLERGGNVVARERPDEVEALNWEL